MGGIFDRILQEVARNTASTAAKVTNEVVPNVTQAASALRNLQTLLPQQIGQQLGGVNNSIANLRGAITQDIGNRVGAASNTTNQLIQNTTSGLLQNVVRIQGDLQSAKSQITSQILSEVGRTAGIQTSAIMSGVAELRNIASQNANAANGLLGSLKTSVENKLTQTINETIKQGANVVSQVTALKNQSEAMLNGLKSGFSSALTATTNEVRQSIISSGAQVAAELMRTKTSIDNKIENISNEIQVEIGRGIGSAITNINNMKDAITSKIDKKLDEISRFMEGIPAIAILLAESLIDLASDKFGDIVKRFGKDFLKLAETNPGIITDLLNGDIKNFTELERRINTKGVAASAAGVVLLVAMFASAIIPALTSMGRPVAQNLEQLALKSVQPNLLPESEVIKAYLRRDFNEEKAHDKLGELGYPKGISGQILDNAERLFTPDVYAELFRRGDIDSVVFRNMLIKLGFDNDHIMNWISLSHFKPSVSDLIQMVVKEAFTPQTAELFGQYDDYPSEFDRQAQRMGIPSEWAKRYWASHWSLPSPTMGFEMLHRRIINNDELKLLLKAQDIMPFWRDKLIKLSYNPLTRVDVRRMHDLGVLDETEVYNAYLDIGYNEVNARRLTEFTVKYNNNNDDNTSNANKKLTRAIIEKAYRYGVYNKEKAIIELTKLGYPATDINTLLALVDLDKEVDNAAKRMEQQKEATIKTILNGYENRIYGRENSILELGEQGYTRPEAEQILNAIDNEHAIKVQQYISDAVKDLFIQRTIDENEATTLLIRGGFNTTEAISLVDELKLLREYRTKKPSLSQLQKLYKAGHITDAEFTEELIGLGYHDKYIEWFRKEALIQ